MKRFIGSLLVAAVAHSCRVDPVIPNAPATGMKEIIPEGWPMPVYRFEKNPISDTVFALGRELFYEPMLSLDNTIACGDCHQQNAAFANAGHELSHGVNGQLGKRNSPALFNLAWHPAFMHDGGINHIEVQPIAPITNPVEMAEDLQHVVEKLQSDAHYRQKFKAAYHTDSITSEKMLKSIAQFMALNYSYHSKYDDFKHGKASFRDEELRGYNLFVEKCAACHREPLFTDFDYRSNGLTVNPTLHDSGRARITRLETDLYKFKTPSLRNIRYSAPYMHDGRYETLEDCLEHYNSGIKNFKNLDPRLNPAGIPLTDQEKTDILAFLTTLSDPDFINDPRFKNPHHPN